MPTGYTQAVMDGEIDFQAFVLQCARAFGPFVMQRDASFDEPPRLTEIDEDSYSVRSLEEAYDKADRLSKMTQDDIDVAYLEYVTDVARRNYDSAVTASRISGNYSRMIRQVKDWDISEYGDEFLPNLKKFMIDQLEKSLENDGKAWVTEIIPSAEEWHAGVVAGNARGISYYTKQVTEERERVTKQNKMALDLYKAVGAIAPEKRIKV